MRGKQWKGELMQLFRNGTPANGKGKRTLSQARFGQAKKLSRKRAESEASGAGLSEPRPGSFQEGVPTQYPDSEAGRQEAIQQETDYHQKEGKNAVLPGSARNRAGGCPLENREFLRQAVVWSEVLSEPVCKRRRRKRYVCGSNAGGR